MTSTLALSAERFPSLSRSTCAWHRGDCTPMDCEFFEQYQRPTLVLVAPQVTPSKGVPVKRSKRKR